MWLVQHIFRPLYSFQAGLIAMLVIRIRWIFKKNLRHNYQMTLNSWESVNTLEGLCTFFRIKYKYLSDKVIDDWAIIILIALPVLFVISIFAFPVWVSIIIAETELLGFGLYDRDNFKPEFFTRFGDCDDVAYYSCGRLIGLGYDAYIIHLWGGKNGHRETIFYDTAKKAWALFNYGRPVYIDEKKGLLEAANSVRKDIQYKRYFRMLWR